jgi:ribosomal protein S18 acetylase RimI-like enzyme
MPVAIRNAFKDEELPRLFAIECECFEPELRWHEPEFSREMTFARKLNLAWVAYIGSRIAGFLVAAVKGRKINIETCNVSRAHRRKGAATKLIAACEKAVKQRGYEDMRLEVYTENPAQILYFQLGYRVCGFVKNYYGLGKHAISMAKRL